MYYRVAIHGDVSLHGQNLSTDTIPRVFSFLSNSAQIARKMPAILLMRLVFLRHYSFLRLKS
jgi:hypothetical protein